MNREQRRGGMPFGGQVLEIGKKDECPLHIMQVLEYTILWDRDGSHMVAMQASKGGCFSCGLITELDITGSQPKPA